MKFLFSKTRHIFAFHLKNSWKMHLKISCYTFRIYLRTRFITRYIHIYKRKIKNTEIVIFFSFDISDITDLLCQHIRNGSVAILYFTNTEKFGRITAASQYFLQMAGFLGIPVIAWNADNAGLESVITSTQWARI